MTAAATARHRRASLLVALAAGTLTLGCLTAPGAEADDEGPYPSASASAPVEVDPEDPDLKLPDGATLAEPKVLDIKTVVEDLGGQERREDTNSDITFALQAEVLFGKDSAKLNARSRSRIVAIADEIREQKATQVRVFGFTDDLGSAAHGDVLSRHRAEAVHGILTNELDGEDITYEVRGYGEDYPISPNDSEEGRKKNRRVEITFPRTSADGSPG